MVLVEEVMVPEEQPWFPWKRSWCPKSGQVPVEERPLRAAYTAERNLGFSPGGPL